MHLSHFFKILPLSELFHIPVLIIHPYCSDILKDYLLRDTKSHILHIDYKIILNPRILFSTILSLWRINFFALEFNSSFLRSLLSQIYKINLYCLLQYLNPKIIITFIDDCNVFSYLTSNLPHIKSIAIMNGLRSYIDIFQERPLWPHPNFRITLDHFVCFGQHDIDIYNLYSHSVKNFHPLGSLLHSIYYHSFKSVSPCSNLPNYDLCYVSQFDKHIMFSHPDNIAKCRLIWRKSLVTIERYLARYVQDSNCSLIIALRNDDCLDEINYFKSIFGPSVSFKTSCRSSFSSYSAVDSSSVIVTLNSTIGVEAFSVSKKILFFNPHSHIHFRQQLLQAGISYLEGISYNSFASRLTFIRNLNQLTYSRYTYGASRYLCNTNQHHPTYSYIKDLINKLLCA